MASLQQDLAQANRRAEGCERQATDALAALQRARQEAHMMQQSRESLALELAALRERADEADELRGSLYEMQRGLDEAQRVRADLEAESARAASLEAELEDVRRRHEKELESMQQRQEASPPASVVPREDLAAANANNLKLIAEIESQELELERLFTEGRLLASRASDLEHENAAWRVRCDGLEEQNERLQEMLQESAQWGGGGADDDDADPVAKAARLERLWRQEQASSAALANALKRAEGDAMGAVGAQAELQRLFVPILATIDERLKARREA